ncbi:MAG: RNase adapter RapZ [Nitrospirota bacterium]|nr:RNase adapter RapZ [Nitrospirota bacterium]
MVGSKNLHFLIVSGLSGAGKSHAIKCFEDNGFFCVDNLPLDLVPKFAELCVQSGMDIGRVALGVDVRERKFLKTLSPILNELRDAGHTVEVVFLEAQDDMLVRRFNETRRPHPLGGDAPLLQSIQQEREMLVDLRRMADRIIDTSELNVHQLRQVIGHDYGRPEHRGKMMVSVLSFGFKYGIPYDIDLLFDVRFLPNPNFVEHLKPLTGVDEQVSDYVMARPQTGEFLERLYGLLDFLLPHYAQEGKSYLTVGIGCTGGRHRSVAIASALSRHLDERGAQAVLRHRDITK